MEAQKNTTPELSSRQVYRLVDLYLGDVLAELVIALHGEEIFDSPAHTACLPIDMDASLMRAKVRLDGARGIFDLLTREGISIDSRKNAVRGIMKLISPSRPANCIDDNVLWDEYARIFPVESVECEL
jgi:hypothetical protein